MKDNGLIFHINTPLQHGDTETTTYGCRATNPDICKFCYVKGICAFTSEDKICKHPSKRWKAAYRELSENK